MSTRKHYTTTDLEKEFGPLTFGNSLESYRLAEEMSQKDFARKLGIAAQSLCDLEKGRRVPSVERAAKIAKKLNEPVETWIALALSDMVREAHLDLRVEVKKKAPGF
jgi:transcriptional regulator with XRE-family HTH domain